MAKILGKFLVSEDVFIYVANGDLTGISYFYNSDEAEIRAREIVKAVEKIGEKLGAYLIPGSEENEIEFSTLPDEITGISEAGKRYEVIALSKEEKEESFETVEKEALEKVSELIRREAREETEKEVKELKELGKDADFDAIYSLKVIVKVIEKENEFLDGLRG